MALDPKGSAGSGFPGGSYAFLLRRGAVTTQLYMGDAAQGDPDAYDEGFWRAIEELATRDRLRLTRCWDSHSTGWWAPMLVLAKPDGGKFPRPPNPNLPEVLAKALHDKQVRMMIGDVPPPWPETRWRSPQYLRWMALIEEALGETLAEARRRAGVTD
jgi:hypothetical protein